MQPSPSVASSDRLKQLLPELFNPSLPSGQQFLRLQLSPELTIAIELTWVEESLQLPTQMVTPIPNMPPSVLGLMSSKGQVFWAVNLAEQLNLPIALKPSQYYEIVVIRTSTDDAMASDVSGQRPDRGDTAEGQTGSLGEQQFLGLVIPKIRGPIRLSPEDITLPTAEAHANKSHANLLPYLTGQAVVDDEMVLLLNAGAIAAAKPILPTEAIPT